MTGISSADNPHFKRLRRLVESGRERRKSGLSLLDGVHLIEAYREHVGEPEEIVASRSALANPEVQRLLSCGKRAALILPDALFRELSSVATPTGIMAVVALPAPRHAPAADLGPCLLLDGVQDPGNVGSILRSAAAFGVRDVLLGIGCAQAWSPRVLRAGMGAHFALRLYEQCDLEAFARHYRGTLIATARDAEEPVYRANLRGDVGLLLGSEGAGLSPALAALAHTAVRIPMPGQAESLNVAGAAAICLYERARQLAAHPPHMR